MFSTRTLLSPVHPTNSSGLKRQTNCLPPRRLSEKHLDRETESHAENKGRGPDFNSPLQRTD